MPGKRNMRFHPRPKARGFPAPESYNVLKELAKEWKKVETFFYPEHETYLDTWLKQKVAEKLPDFHEKS